MVPLPVFSVLCVLNLGDLRLTRRGRNARFFDEEFLKLDQWSDDLKGRLEREIKEIDRDIREARKTAALAGTLADKLETLRALKDQEACRGRNRRDLFDAQDGIDKQRHTVAPVFTIHWDVV